MFLAEHWPCAGRMLFEYSSEHPDCVTNDFKRPRHSPGLPSNCDSAIVVCYELEITTVLTVRNRGRDKTILLCSSPGNYVNKIRADSWGYAFGTFPRLQISAASESGRSKRLNRGINCRTCFKMSRGSASRAEEISITAVSEGVFMRLSKWPIYFSL